MKNLKDNFTKQSKYYKKYRPTYPTALYSELISMVENHNDCWDCGTGNGQVAIELAKNFKKVKATDISEKQLLNASKKDNIEYTIQRAEQTNFSNNQFDLVTVAQALHWFDFDAFNIEVHRVVKNNGVLAAWGYALLQIDSKIDILINNFYHNIIGPYWDPERKHVDTHYKNIPLNFNEIQLKKEYTIEVNWRITDLEGYLNSWSSVQNFINKNKYNPVTELTKELSEYWRNNETKKVTFPIFARVGIIKK